MTLPATAFQRKPLHPAFVCLVASAILVAWVIIQAGGDPLSLARLGTRYSQGDPNGTEGYDGQFIYYIARNPDPVEVLPYLDVPAYRYQRILLPLLARYLSLGKVEVIPWMLAGLGIFAQAAGTWAVAELLIGWGVSGWYALVYALWVGFILAVRLDLPEPLAYSLVAGALLSQERGKPWLAWPLLGLALLAKEVIALFVVAALLSSLQKKDWKNASGLLLVSILPYIVFQLWLWKVFGQPGIGSGGAMATPFELIPLMGLLRIGYFSPVYLLAMLVVFLPAVIVPALWGVWMGIRKWITGDASVVVLALIMNALAIFFLPFSTYRETGGLLRFACGLVMCVLLFTSRFHMKKALNYSFLWLVLNVFLLKS